MFPQMLRLVLVATLLAAPAAAEPVRKAIAAFGTQAEIEVRDLPSAEAESAVLAALQEIFALDHLFDPDGEVTGGLGVLNRAAGGGAVEIDPRVSDLLLRGLQFCIWSGGAYGPLGGELYRLWDQRPDSYRPPDPADLREAVGTAECNRVSLDPKTHAAILAPGSRVDAFGLSRGLAVDRAVAVLTEHGAANAWVEVGNVWRALGAGPSGHGWLAELPPIPGEEEPIDRIWLHDQALVVYSTQPVNEETLRPVIDQRTGVPSRGVISVIAVTVQAVDAEPLAATLFVLGHRDGQMRLGSLDPRPSVFWLLGQGIGTGRPLEATYYWTQLDRVRR